MLFDIVLAIGAAVVAIIGTLHDSEGKGDGSISRLLKPVFSLRNWDRKLLLPRLLILSAFLICGIAILKAIDDYNDKEFIKYGIVETLTPTSDIFNGIYHDIDKLVDKKIYYDPDYGISSDGMVVCLQRRGPGDTEHKEAMVLSNADLSKLSAQIILKEDTSILLNSAWNQNFDFSTYDQDLYSRLCALFRSSVRRVLSKNPVDCDQDDKKGIRLIPLCPGIQNMGTGEVKFVIEQITNITSQGDRRDRLPPLSGRVPAALCG